MSEQPQALMKGRLCFRGMTKRYGLRAVLRELDLSVEQGSIHALEGTNGSGKSTLFDIGAGFLVADGGSILLERDDGRVIELTGASSSKRVRDGLAYIPQTCRALDRLSTLDNLRIAQGSGKGNGSSSDSAVFLGLEELQLSSLLGKRPSLMERSDRVFLALAQAYLQKPLFLMIDEPFVGLSGRDLQHCIAILGRLRDLGTGILVTDHNARAILDIADVVSIVKDGQIVFSGAGHEVRVSGEASRLYFRVNA